MNLLSWTYDWLKQRCCFCKGQDCESKLKYNPGVCCENFYFNITLLICQWCWLWVWKLWVKFRCLHQDIRTVDIKGWESHPRVTLQSIEEKWAPSESDSSQPKIDRSGNLPPGDACFSPLTVGKPTATNSELNVQPFSVWSWVRWISPCGNKDSLCQLY